MVYSARILPFSMVLQPLTIRYPLNLMTIFFKRHVSTISPERYEKLRLYQLRKKGHVISFDEYCKKVDSFRGSAIVIARDNKGCILEGLPDYVVESSSRPVTFKARGSLTHLHLAVQRKNVREIKRLIKNGADINAPGIGGRSPLFNAVRTGSPKIVDLLMLAGANPHQYETSSWNYNITAFHEALDLRFYEITRLFIEKWGVSASQPVAFRDYGWPPEAIEFAAHNLEKLTPFKRNEAEKIMLLLLQHLDGTYIRNRNRLYDIAVKNNMYVVANVLRRDAIVTP